MDGSRPLKKRKKSEKPKGEWKKAWNSCNGTRIGAVCFRPAKTGCFPKQIGMKRVNDIGGETFVEEKSEDAAAVMPGGFKSCFSFAQFLCA